MTEIETMNELLNSVIKNAKNRKIAISDAYTKADMKTFFPNFFGSIWEDTLANGIKTKDDPKFEIADSRLLETIRNAVHYSSVKGYEGVFYIESNGIKRFFNGEIIQNFEYFNGTPRLVYIQIREDDPFNTIKQPIIFCFNFEKRTWSMWLTSDGKAPSANFAEMNKQLSTPDESNLIILGMDSYAGTFDDTPVMVFKNNPRSKPDLEGLMEYTGIIDYLMNQVPETHDYERIKYEINLMFNAELDKKEEDQKLRNERVDTKVNQDERYTTATSIIQGQTTVEVLNRVVENWLATLFKLSKTPSLSSGLEGKNQKGSSEVVGADPLATSYALAKKDFFNMQIKRWIAKNKKLTSFLGKEVELIISPLLDLKLKFIAEGVITGEKRENENKTELTTKNVKG